MALTERTEEDKIEIVGQHKHVQVRTATVIERDSVDISRAYHRHVVAPGECDSDQSTEVQAICAAVHTADVISAWQASQISPDSA